MKTLIATVLATAISSTFAYAQDMKNDPAQYRTVTQKATADYKMAAANCKSMSGTARTVCIDEAKVAQARANTDAVIQYNNSTKLLADARTKLAHAEFALAKSRCAGMVSTDKASCMNTAQSVHVAALADAKSGRSTEVATNTGIVPPGMGTATTTDATKAAAVDKCAQIAGKPDTGCLIDNRTAATTGTSGAAATTTAGTAAATMAQKTENAAATAADKTRDAAATVANKTENAVDKMAAKSEQAAEKTGDVVADSVITTKVKADIFKEPELKSMAIHVETEKGVVMLSGFVDSKADAEKAARIAGTVKGVTSVKSALKVK